MENDNQIIMARISFMPSLDSIRAVCKFSPIPDCGVIMPLKDFIGNVEDNFLMDYDGSGQLILDNQVIRNSSTNCMRQTFEIGHDFIVSMWALFREYSKDFKVIWFNINK